MKFTNICVRDVSKEIPDPDNASQKVNEPSERPINKDEQYREDEEQKDVNIKQTEEPNLQDQSDNKNLPTKEVIDDQEYTNNQICNISEQPLKDQAIQEEQNPPKPPPPTFSKKPPRKAASQPKYEPTISEINSIRKRVKKSKRPIRLTVTLEDIGMENFDQPIRLTMNEKELPRLRSARKLDPQNQENRIGSKDEELPKLKKNKNAVFVERKDEKTQTQPIQKPANKKSPRKKIERISRYDPSLFYSPICPEHPVRAPRQFNDPIVLNVTLKDIGMDGFGSPAKKRNKRVTYEE